MKGNSKRPPLLQWLAALTAIALAGIIVLQANWLRTSYNEQQARFRADVENAMLAALIKSQLSSAIAHSSNDKAIDPLKPGLAALLSSIISKAPQSAYSSSPATVRSITVNMTDTNAPDARALRRYMAANRRLLDTEDIILDLETEDLPGSSALQLDSLKRTIESELRQRAIATPMALSMNDSDGRLLLATCDMEAFKNIPVKSALTDARLGPAGIRLQAAFPDANLYLLRRMGWLLTISALLVLIGSASFAWLVSLFFRQKKLADIRSDFMNNMTHELKTPIASVSVALELMQDARQPVSEEKKSEYLSIAQGELQRLTMLVEKVLKMAAFERSEIRIAPEAFLAAAWLDGIVASMRPVSEVAGAIITTKVQPELLMLYADKTHLTNVAQNLLENALKYNGRDVPCISISIREEGDAAVLEMKDNGKGIPAAYLRKVFDKFFRVPTGDQHDTKGYGLGLSYVKAIAELHGGSVSVSSIPGEQTSFTVTLPKQSS